MSSSISPSQARECAGFPVELQVCHRVPWSCRTELHEQFSRYCLAVEQFEALQAQLQQQGRKRWELGGHNVGSDEIDAPAPRVAASGPVAGAPSGSMGPNAVNELFDKSSQIEELTQQIKSQSSQITAAEQQAHDLQEKLTKLQRKPRYWSSFISTTEESSRFKNGPDLNGSCDNT
eukprot:s559_g2.t1